MAASWPPARVAHDQPLGRHAGERNWNQSHSLVCIASKKIGAKAGPERTTARSGRTGSSAGGGKTWRRPLSDNAGGAVSTSRGTPRTRHSGSDPEKHGQDRQPRPARSKAAPVEAPASRSPGLPTLRREAIEAERLGSNRAESEDWSGSDTTSREVPASRHKAASPASSSTAPSNSTPSSPFPGQEGHTCIIWDSLTGSGRSGSGSSSSSGSRARARGSSESSPDPEPRVPLSTRPDYSSTLRRILLDADGPPPPTPSAPLRQSPVTRNPKDSGSQPAAPRESATSAKAERAEGRTEQRLRGSGGAARDSATDRGSTVGRTRGGDGGEFRSGSRGESSRESRSGSRSRWEGGDGASCPEDVAIQVALSERRTGDAVRMVWALHGSGGRPSSRSWSRCLAQLSIQGRVEEALKIFQEIQGGTPGSVLSPEGRGQAPGSIGMDMGSLSAAEDVASGAGSSPEGLSSRGRGSLRSLGGEIEEGYSGRGRSNSCSSGVGADADTGLRGVGGASEGCEGPVLDGDALEQLVLCCAKKGKFGVAEQALEAMLARGMQPRVAVWSALVAAMGKDPVAAPSGLELFDRMVLLASAETVLSTSSGAAELGSSAEGVAEGARSPMLPDTGAFNAALNAAVTSGQVPVAEALVAVRMPQLGVRPDFRSYNILLKGHAAQGDKAKLSTTYAEMKAKGLHRDVSTANTLISSFAVLGDLSAAEAVLQEYEAAAAFSSAQGSLLVGGARPAGPTVRTLTTLLNGYVQADQWERALLLFEAMKRNPKTHPNEVTYCTLINGLVARALQQRPPGRKQREALSEQSQLLLEGLPKAQAQAQAAQGRGGDSQSSARPRGIRGAYQGPAGALGAGAGAGVRAGASTLPRATPPLSAAEELVKWNWEGVLPALAQARGSEAQGAGDGTSISDGLAADAAAADAGAGSGAGGGPRQTRRQYRGYMEQALRLLSEMLSRGVPPNAVLFNVVLKGLFGLGMEQQGEQLLLAMKDSGVAPTAATYNTLIASHAQEGDTDQAWRWLQRMRAEGVEASRETYTTVLGMLSEGGDVERAQEVFRMLRAEDGVGADAVAWSAMLGAYARAGGSEQAWKLYREMKESGISPTLGSYGALVRVLRSADKAPEALVVWRDLRTRMERESILKEEEVEEEEEEEEEGEGEEEGGEEGLDMEEEWLGQQLGPSSITPSSPRGPTVLKGAPSAASAAEDVSERGRPKQEESRRAWGAGSRAVGPPPAPKFSGVGVRRSPVGLPDEAIMDDLVHVCVRAGYFQRALEVVRVMERAGMSPDKLKYRRMFIDLYHDKTSTSDPFKQLPGSSPSSSSSSSVPMSRQGGRSFEAFKFWLGLPNNLYETEWSWQPEA